jgi:hypothetical protein
MPSLTSLSASTCQMPRFSISALKDAAEGSTMTLAEPLWTETQNNIPLDATGHYSVQLGITKPSGVPTTLFTTGEARWLGVQVAEQGEQPRVLLLSVPYALKAGNAATIGGLPPSAFVLAAQKRDEDSLI